MAIAWYARANAVTCCNQEAVYLQINWQHLSSHLGSERSSPAVASHTVMLCVEWLCSLELEAEVFRITDDVEITRDDEPESNNAPEVLRRCGTGEWKYAKRNKKASATVITAAVIQQYPNHIQCFQRAFSGFLKTELRDAALAQWELKLCTCAKTF